MPQGNFVKITKAKVTCSSTFAAKKNSFQMHMIYPRYAIWGCEGMTRCEVTPKSSKTSMKTQTCWHSHFLIHHKSVCDTTYSKKLKKKNFMAPFYGWGSTASRLVPLQRGSLLFTTKFPDIPGTHFIDLGRMKGLVDLVATPWFWTRDPWIGNPTP